MIDCVFSQQL